MAGPDLKCLRCRATVYPVDKVGPLKDFTFYHQGCFKCKLCGTKLTLKTYFNNLQDQDDQEVYCQNHAPKTGPGTLDGTAVGIKAALSAPKTHHLVNEQIRGLGHSGAIDVDTFKRGGNGHMGDFKYGVKNHGRFDASALHITHALQAARLASAKYYNENARHLGVNVDAETQRTLEMRHRMEEDDLYRQFAKKRVEEETVIQHQIREEWEKELEKLTSRYHQEIRRKRNNFAVTPDEERAMTMRHQKDKDDLEKNMTVKLDRRKEALTRKLMEAERAATADLVEKHAEEMLNLINEKREEIVQRDGGHIHDSSYPLHPPTPGYASISKLDIYVDPSVFQELDQQAINVAQADQRTFTDLVRQLTHNCETDVEKARAIFRWITVKNLNQMTFDETVNADTPMGILRGIKHGTESYHVLFKRLCSYAGLHCVVIKGYSKSAGYQPGIRFDDSRFRNSWNAVYVAGAWRFVQCNWGARHLVNAREVPRNGSRSESDKLRYEYDDHYFLTDAREFIYEFFPQNPEWQLLKKPITLRDFEELPFVRSLFFRYGLYFPDPDTKATLFTDHTGGTTVRIGMPHEPRHSLIFHYSLKYFDHNDQAIDNFDGVSLKRFVMQSVVDNVVAFRVHAPCSGTFLLDIFANSVSPEEYLTGEPMKFKSVTKFRILCEDLHTVMIPLPECAGGEWGPEKALRLFGLDAVSHEDALIIAGRELQIQFRMTRPLSDFLAALHMNGCDEKKLSKFVSHSVSGDVVSFFLSFPEDGQYGLDIYTRDPNEPQSNGHYDSRGKDKQLLTHCCKYLINVSRR